MKIISEEYRTLFLIKSEIMTLLLFKFSTVVN